MLKYLFPNSVNKQKLCFPQDVYSINLQCTRVSADYSVQVKEKISKYYFVLTVCSICGGIFFNSAKCASQAPLPIYIVIKHCVMEKAIEMIWHALSRVTVL